MKNKYYIVYIKNDFTILDLPIICKVITIENTQKYGYYPVFEDIITGKIIRPYYDTTTNQLYNKTYGTLTYNNLDKSMFFQVSVQDVLRILRNLTSETYDEQYQILNSIEERNIPRVKIL